MFCCCCCCFYQLEGMYVRYVCKVVIGSLNQSTYWFSESIYSHDCQVSNCTPISFLLLGITARFYSSSISSFAFPSLCSLWTCTLFLLCRFSLHFPISLPDSWRRLCCISYTESNAITVSARGATYARPRRGSGTQQGPPST